jgi:uncharacterized protein YqeY
MSNTIKAQMDADLKTAMKAHDKEKVQILRFVLAAIKQKEVDERISLDETQCLSVLDKMARQHREALTQFQEAGRTDLADKEALGLAVIQSYLPTPLSDEELLKLIQEAIVATQASSAKDMGLVMAHLKPFIQGRAEGGIVSKLVKDALCK